VAVNYWGQPETVTRTGASHLRRGVICQDASGSQVLTDRNGQPIQVLVVADGHGGQRYTHSEVGSRLACELALKLLADQFSQWSSTKDVEIQRWRSWLVETFPNSLHQRWLASVERHWRQKITEKDAFEQPFSPIPYGTTLGVVIMTPTWWGHTGLGDWDLVRVRSGGDVALVNEETDESQTSGEATYSLCLSNAAIHFAVRSAVYPISQDTPSFALLLSTDGVRKSCSTDDDFFAIAKYLCEGDQPRAGETANDLNSDLDRISSQGSGDDVSVAIGRWLGTDQTRSKRAALRRNQRLRRSRAVIVQPRDVNPDRGRRTADPVSYGLSDDNGSATSESKKPGIGEKPLLLIISGLVLASAVGLSFFSFLRGGVGNGAGKAGETFVVKPELKTVVEQEADALCNLNQTPIPIRDLNQNSVSGLSEVDGNTNNQPMAKGHTPISGPISLAEDKSRPGQKASKVSNVSNNLLTATLDQRKSIFKGLVSQPKSLSDYLHKPSNDPLGALIAWSFPDKRQHDGSTSSLESAVDSCPQLIQALAVQWERAKDEQQSALIRDDDDINNSRSSINDLYQALSKKDFERASLFYSEKVEDQFTPEFFRQFHQVTVDQLKPTSNSRRVLTIEGDVTLQWPDGTKQIERRLFVVDANQLLPIIIASEFKGVIEPRPHLLPMETVIRSKP